jgi:DNA-binding MarR family transcriptional regulator
MPPPFEELSSLDRLVHEPARLAILTALSSCRTADFLYLRSLTGLTSGNLSQHLGKLERGGLIAVEKAFKGKVPHTSIELTPQGRETIRRHWRRLEQLHKAAAAWRPFSRVNPAEA